MLIALHGQGASRPHGERGQGGQRLSPRAGAQGARGRRFGLAGRRAHLRPLASWPTPLPRHSARPEPRPDDGRQPAKAGSERPSGARCGLSPRALCDEACEPSAGSCAAKTRLARGEDGPRAMRYCRGVSCCDLTFALVCVRVCACPSALCQR